jgi:hypothetical protein
MADPTFLAGGHVPNRNDAQWMIEQRILGAIVDGGGLSGTGAPSNSIGNVGDTYVDISTGQIYAKDVTNVWVIVSGSAGPAGGSGLVGVVDPNGFQTASPGTTYSNIANHSMWIKETGVGNTGWVNYVGAVA